MTSDLMEEVSGCPHCEFKRYEKTLKRAEKTKTKKETTIKIDNAVLAERERCVEIARSVDRFTDVGEKGTLCGDECIDSAVDFIAKAILNQQDDE